ncbi:unnamed protein product [Closterium sp. NIES-65]|nr:unnamed protein product [Closterium sp. NIES-65]
MAWQVFGVIETDAERTGGEGKTGEGSEAEGPDAKRVKLEGGVAAAGATANGGSPGGKRKLFVGSNALGYRRDFMEVVPSVSNGLLSDWEGVAAIWEHALKDRLLVDPKEHAVLLAEPSFNPPAAREKTVQLMFETLGSPAVFLARNAVLTSFSCGKATSLVVDSGFSSSTVAAVHDGYVLQKSLRRSPVAGDALTEFLSSPCLPTSSLPVSTRLHSSPHISSVPSFPSPQSLRRSPVAGDALTEFLLRSVGRQKLVDQANPHTTDSYRLYMQKATAADMKETLCISCCLSRSLAPSPSLCLSPCPPHLLSVSGPGLPPHHGQLPPVHAEGDRLCHVPSASPPSPICLSHVLTLQLVDQAYPNTTDSYRLYMQKATAADMKETVCRVPDAPYDVPTCPQCTIASKSIASADPSSGGWTAEAIADAAKSPGIARMVVDSISKCDVDIRKDLYSSVLVRGKHFFDSNFTSGGTMAMQQIKERLEKELMAVSHHNQSTPPPPPPSF